MVFDDAIVEFSEADFPTFDWTDFYGNVSEVPDFYGNVSEVLPL